ncbi:MAG: hypothetical protein ACRENC_03455, partial [Gemmatimonadaceae bacterium]
MIALMEPVVLMVVGAKTGAEVRRVPRSGDIRPPRGAAGASGAIAASGAGGSSDTLVESGETGAAGAKDARYVVGADGATGAPGALCAPGALGWIHGRLSRGGGVRRGARETWRTNGGVSFRSAVCSGARGGR